MELQFNSEKFMLRVSRALAAYLAALVLILSVSAGQAWSFDTYNAVTGEEVSIDSQSKDADLMPLITNTPSPAMVDSCLPLLKSIRHNSPSSAMDRNQRSAGKAAALGLVFGVRFALGPVEKPRFKAPKARLDVWQHNGSIAGNRHALAVSSYRQCQKEQALEALREFRWKR